MAWVLGLGRFDHAAASAASQTLTGREPNAAYRDLEQTPKNLQALTTAEVVAQLGSSPEGLSSAEASRRLREHGPNRLRKARRQPALLRFARECFRFFSVILWVAAGLAGVAEWADPGEGMAQIAYGVVAVIVVSSAFSFWQEYRVERILSALQKLLPPHARAMRDGSVQVLPVEQLVIGDVILLQQGDNVPADCRLIEAFGVRVNTATVTGESASKARDTKPAQTEDPLHGRNLLLAGTSMVAGEGKAMVYATGSQTEFGRIAHLTQTTRATVSPLRKELAHLSRFIAVLAVTIGLAFLAIALIVQVPFWKGVIFSIGIIVAMVPEGLLPTLTLALVLAAQRMAKRNVLIRNLTSVETLGSATVICTDKTGTLTENRMQVRELLLGDTHYFLSECEAHSEIARQHADFFSCANCCHAVTESRTDAGMVLLGDPMEIALVEMQRNLCGGMPVSPRLDEVPFDSDRMRQSVVHAMPGGSTLYCKGAPESVLPLCTSIVSEGKRRELDAAMRNRVVRQQEEMADRGLRVLALASRRLPAAWSHESLEGDLAFHGLVGLQDPARSEVPDAIRRCHEAGIKVIMITGDHPRTAKAIAAQIGLIRTEHAEVVTSDQLRALSASDLQLVVDRPDVIFARVGPDDKMRIVDALKSQNHVVAVTGDGVNDAPALKSAHIGIAMGICGTDVAKEAADMVLLDDNFASIVSAVEEGRAVFQNIRKFLTYVLVHNVAELVPYLAFVLFRIPLALTPIQILSVDMGTDSLTALALGTERPDPQAMRLPPRPRDERLLTPALAFRAYLFLGLIEAAAGMAAFFLVALEGGWTYGTSLAWNDPLYLRATTACLSAIIVLQIVNVFLCRSSVRSVFSTSVLANPLILWGVAFEIALLLAYNHVPLATLILGTAPVLGDIWLVLIAFGLAMLVLEEARKWVVRRKLRQIEAQVGR